jgi:amino acid adenylation domain-containing protein
MSDVLSQIMALPPDKRDLFLKRLKEKKAAQSKGRTIIRRETGPGPFPLSFSQQSLWIHDRLEPGSSKYIAPAAARIKGRLDVEALERSLNEIVKRHESWRTSFATEGDNPVQVIAPSLTVTIPMSDLRGVPEAEREARAQSLTVEEGRKPFDLARLPLFRPMLLRLGEEDYIFLLTKHHIISDRWSLKLIVEELISHYEAYSAGGAPTLPEPAIQYKDYAAWQREWLQGEVLAAHLDYWNNQLGGTLPVLELPTDRPRASARSYGGKRRLFRLPRPLAAALNDLQRQENATLFMLMLAAFNVALYRYSDQEDIITGVPVANRNRPELETVIGFFANILAMRCDLSGDPSFRELLGRVRKVSLDGFAHQDLPFEKLVQELQPGRDPGRNPLFQVTLSVQNIPLPTLRMGDLTLDVLDLDWEITRFDLSLSIWEMAKEESPDGGLSMLFLYNADILDEATIDRMAGHFRTLLEGVAADPARRISALPLLGEAERRQILVEWNSIELPVARDVCFHQLFEAQVERTPGAAAVVFRRQQLTYRELNDRANQLAHYLMAHGVGPEKLVGIYMERSVDMMVALLGILKAGGAYVPFDPDYPKERLSLMIEDSRALAILTQQKLLADLPLERTKAICLDADGQEISRQSSRNPANAASAENLVYVIYTSGSTGRPKGVMVQHRSLVNLAAAFNEAVYAGRRAPLKVSMNAPLAFDASVKQLMQLAYGHALYILPEEVRLDSDEIISFIARHGLDVLDVTPSMMKLLLAAGLSGTAETSPEVVFVAGEALDEASWNHLARNDWTDFYNLYGPTECTDDTTYFLIRIPPARPTIGRQIANIRLYILDRHLNVVPVGVTGELYIGGASPARGYLGRPEATAEKYIPDPFSPEQGARMYKTGDLTRHMPDGNIEFIGRVDHQVKIRGFRIELGEIESALSRHPSVREAAAIAREDSPGDKRLVAYVVPGERPIDVSELREHLEERLPDYMIPSAFVTLDAMPLTPNKKVDKRALPPPDQSRPELRQSYAAPRDAVEEELAGIWADTLGLDRVGIHDNFFKLGGHSLLAIQLLLKVRQRLGAELLLTSLFRAPTVAALAALIAGKDAGAAFSVLVPIRSGGTWPPLFCIHGAGGQVMLYQHLADSHDLEQAVFGLQSRGLSGLDREHESLEQMAADYAGVIREQQPHGPYYLLGWSMGGVIAVSVARELERQNEDVAFVGLVDSYLFEDDPFTFDSDPLLGISLTFGGALTDAFNALDARDQQAFRDELLSLSPEERIERVIGWGQRRDLIPADLSAEVIRQQVALAEIHDGLLRAHNAPVIQTSLHVWWAGEKAQAGLPRTDWGKYTRGTVHEETIGGNHFTILRPPHCNVLAERLQIQLVVIKNANDLPGPELHDLI